MYVSIYSIDQRGAKKALELQERNYLTKMLDVVTQRKLKQKDSDLDQAVEYAQVMDITQTKKTVKRSDNYKYKEVKAKVVKKAPKESKSYRGAGQSDDFDW